MGKARFMVIDNTNGRNLGRYDISHSKEYKPYEWKRHIVEHYDLQPDITVLFEDDIDYDWNRLHQGLHVYPDGSVVDNRPTEYMYEFKKSVVTKKRKKLSEVKGSKTSNVPLSEDEIEGFKELFDANEVKEVVEKVPSDAFLSQIENNPLLVEKELSKKDKDEFVEDKRFWDKVVDWFENVEKFFIDGNR